MRDQKIDDRVQKWYKTHFIPTGLGYKKLDWHLAKKDMIKNKDVLNLGCHYPLDEFVLGIHARRWVAIDFTEEVIKRCKEEFKFPHMDRVEFWVADMRNLPFSEEFDTVLDFSSSDHVKDERHHIREEVFRVLKPGGYHVVTYANREFFEKDEDHNQFGYEIHMTPLAIYAELTTVGFEIVDTDSTKARSGLVGRKPL